MTARSLMALAVVALAGPVQAQGVDQWGKGLELSAHRSLLDRIAQTNAQPTPFTTDGCSGGLSDVWSLVADNFPSFGQTHEERPPWETCCVTHDRVYHIAGNAKTAEDSYAARLAADRDLRTCVAETGRDRDAELAEVYGATPDQVRAAYGTISQAMYLAVRFGGGPCTGLSWRWGYGYPNCFGSESEDN